MAKVTYTRLSDRAVRAAIAGPNGPVWGDLSIRAQRIVNQAKRNAPVDNGTLRNSITYELADRRGKLTARVGTNVHYARFVHDGTGLYGPRGQVIRPKRAKQLSWPVRAVRKRGGRASKSSTPTSWAHAKWVRGVKPRPFLLDAMPKGLGRTRVKLK